MFEKLELHLSALDGYSKLRAVYAEWFKRREKAYRSYGHNSTAEAPPESGGEAAPPGGE